jgi:hypothetical protein
MASTHKHIRSSTANKRPTTAIADGQIALNTNSSSPGLFFKDSTGATIIKVGPVHIGATAPNATPPSGGSSGNSTGEVWLDTGLTPNGVKIWDGSAWVNATPIGSTTVQGLLELATNAETQTGSDTARAVTPAGLQSKLSDSTSTTSSTTIASSTAVKAAYDLANAALPKSGGTVTGNLEIGNTGSLSFEGATADAFETTIAVTDPTADRTITLPDTTGTVVTTGDTGTVTSTMIADGTIVNGDINASAAIAGTKISPDFGSQTIATTGIVSHALGTAGAPTVTFTGDTNTGIYSPGADQVAISTNGTGRLFVDASGNVGIGVAPAGKFHVGTGGTYENLLFTAPAANQSKLFLSATSSGPYLFQNAATSEFNIATDFPSGFITFGTGASGTEKLRITSDGKLGLGSSSPVSVTGFGSLLTIADNAGGAIVLRDANTSVGYKNRFIASVDGEIHFGICADDGTSPVTHVLLDGAGRLGIGTNSPNKLLHVAGTEAVVGAYQFELEGRFGGYGAGLQFSSRTTNGGTLLGMAKITADGEASWDTTAANQDAGLRFYTTLNGTLAEKLRINASGNVGIGTTSPAGTLSVNNASANSVIEVTRGAAGAGYGYTIVGADGATTPALRFQTISNGVWGSEVARFDSSGRLLVGTSLSTSTNSVVQVRSDSGLNMEIFRASADDGAPNIWLSKSRGTAASPSEVSSEDVLGRIVFRGYDGAGWANAAFIEGIADGTWTDGGDTTDNPGALVFSTTANGASSPTERVRITSDAYVRLASGSGGIQFGGDTAAANALDDYEEGTWTPFYRPETGAFTSVNYDAVRYGKYTKIGNLVICSFALRTDAITVGTASGDVYIGGLPFTTPTTAGPDAGSGSVGYSATFAGDVPSSFYVRENDTALALYYRTTANGSATTLDVTDLGTGANVNYIIGVASYFVS